MQRLLAGLIVRVYADEPAERWTLSNWLAWRLQLAGAGDQWELSWDRRPEPEHIAAALTDPVAGIAGEKLAAAADNSYIDVTLDKSRLRLRRTP